MFKSLLRIIFLLALNHGWLLASEGLTDANGYQEHSNLPWKWAMESLEVFPLEKDDTVLDLGCGTGSITIEIAAKVPSGIVIGLDISEEMLTYAREHYQASNVIYMQGDARDLPFVEQFDKVVALLTLNWIKEQELALASIYNALKYNGKALITRPGKQPSNLGPIAQELVKTTYWAPYFSNFEQKKYYYSAEEYATMLEAAGFSVEKISQNSTHTYFKDKEALIGFIYPLCNFIDHLSSDLQEQFVKEVVNVMLESNQTFPDGSILLHDFKLEVIVSKPMSASPHLKAPAGPKLLYSSKIL